jgi:flagellar protein FliS
MTYDTTAAYRTGQVTTSNAAGQVVLLYEGAIRFTAQSIARLEAGDRIGSHQASLRAQAILSALRESLDMSAGDVARRLDAIYDFVTRQLIEGNLAKDPRPARQVLPLLRELLDAWRAAAQATAPHPLTPMPTPSSEASWRAAEAIPGGLSIALPTGLRA